MPYTDIIAKYAYATTYLAGRPALAQLLSHESILKIAEACSLLEVVLRQEHVEQTQLLCSLLQVLNDRRVRAEAFDGTFANLLDVDRVGWYAFFFDELLDLHRTISIYAWYSDAPTRSPPTMSNVFFARSLTKGLAIMGIFSEALGWPSADTMSFSETSSFCFCILYGTDMLANRDDD